MSQSRQDKALSQANALLALMVQFQGLRSSLDELIYQYISETYNTIWGALPTAALNADGSLGAADPSPVSTHPIDTRVGNASVLTKVISQSQLVAGISFLQDFQKFLNNQAVSTSQRSQTLDDLAS
jgi:hypothetical protein